MRGLSSSDLAVWNWTFKSVFILLKPVRGLVRIINSWILRPSADSNIELFVNNPRVLESSWRTRIVGWCFGIIRNKGLLNMAFWVIESPVLIWICGDVRLLILHSLRHIHVPRCAIDDAWLWDPAFLDVLVNGLNCFSSIFALRMVALPHVLNLAHILSQIRNIRSKLSLRIVRSIEVIPLDILGLHLGLEALMRVLARRSVCMPEIIGHVCAG